jgi:cadmium resistance protein CadD (predicted permease)
MVALLTLAAGGDNLAVYVPLFAAAPRAIPVYAAVFAAMTALWCWAAGRLAAHPWAGAFVGARGRALLPVVLIGLGASILAGPLSQAAARQGPPQLVARAGPVGRAGPQLSGPGR